MNQGLDIKINKLPSPTWNWLHMNETELKKIKLDKQGLMEEKVPVGIDKREERFSSFEDIKTGMGNGADILINSAGISPLSFSVKEGIKEAEPLKLDFSYEGGENAGNSIELYAGKDSEVTLIMDYKSSGEGLALVQTKIHAEENSLVRLIQVNRHSKDFICMNDIGVNLSDNAEIDIINLFLGGKETYAGCHTALNGQESRLNTDIGYMTYENQKLDMNYVASHKGKKTKSVINASGVLKDNAFKIFRGTIDFLNGSSGSEGDEKEDVLLLSEGVVNQTIPLILCAEEDVQGNHGATIGRLDEDLMFYMESRGMSHQEIYELMANARIDAICNMIPDEDEKKRIQEYLGRGMEDE